jgi:hypothetical protein
MLDRSFAPAVNPQAIEEAAWQAIPATDSQPAFPETWTTGVCLQGAQARCH